MRTDHQIRVCDFLSVSGSFVSVASSSATCSCVRSSHPRPSHCVGAGVPWVSMPGPTSVPSVAQAGWHRGQSANSVLCLCCVVVARAFDNLELWLPDLSRWPGLLRFCRRSFCILELVLHALRLNSVFTLPSRFGFDLCRQTGDLCLFAAMNVAWLDMRSSFHFSSIRLFMTFQAC